MTRPNILFFQVDQLTALALRPYGDPVCHSPVIDSIADQGLVFENAYCNFPLCAPSRFSMASGQLCSTIGAYDNAAEFPAEIPTYAHYLRDAGYRTCLSGKMHFIGPDQFHGFEERLTPDLYPADFSWVPNWGDEGKRDTNDPRSVLISGLCERSVQIDFDEEVTQQAERFLYDVATSGEDRPFFLQVSYTHPHEPYLCRREFWDLYPDGVPQPTTGALTGAEHDAHSVRLLRDFGMLDYTFSDEDIQRSRRGYYGSISYLDSLIDRVLHVLRHSGLADNTVLVFTSDHGDMLGERGLWFKKHFYEHSLRVPLFIHGPGISPGRVQSPVSLVDLLPTFNALAESNTAPVEPLAGSNLLSLAEAEDDERAVYSEYLAEATTSPLCMIRRGRYKFVYSSKDPYLLFDLSTDPAERRNLTTDSDKAALVSEFESEARRQWNEASLTRDIIRSQKRRLLVRSAHGQGAPVRWNHGESPGQKVRWYRGEEGYSEWAFRYLPPQSDTIA